MLGAYWNGYGTYKQLKQLSQNVSSVQMFESAFKNNEH